MPKDVQQALEEKENGKQVSVNEESNAAETQEQETANTDVEKIDADKIVQPYIDRITKEQAKKNDYKSKYEKALKELDELKANGGKSAKEITENDERLKEIANLKKQNAELSATLAHNKTISDVNAIFKKAELSVSDEVLNMVANTNAEVTASNAKAIINLINEARESGRQSILQGKTPKAGGHKPTNQDDALKKALGL
ncbi:capsid assembly scaffolding protein Gp46 family protein [Lactobacillus iners]|uniref:capsid assembly scaffolding protein Gp46 family protein n=1 Tax=Lactobacillus iners TaxID=147802 RepID=UPI0013E1BE29|nr:DUF4355 domain-containing protein [Lactobacillus iners]QIH21214.1 DUF4355 domain-containing protein [Lactobacillus iners]